VLVVPNAHYENLYDLPAAYGHAVHDLVREVAIAIQSRPYPAFVAPEQRRPYADRLRAYFETPSNGG
jgi:histidine triad (HIT) family protein